MIKGIVSKVSSNNWADKTGKRLVLHSFRLADDGGYYNCGTTPTSVNEGELVEFDGVDKGGGKFQVNVASIKVLKEASTEVVEPANRSSKTPTSGSWKKGVTKDEYWNRREERDITTQSVIQLQSSRNSAVALATLILDNGGLDLEKVAKGKKKEVIEALVQELTEKYEHQADRKRQGTDGINLKVENLVEDVQVAEQHVFSGAKDEWA